MVPYAKENTVSGNVEFIEDVTLKQDAVHNSKKEFSLNGVSHKVEFEVPIEQAKISPLDHSGMVQMTF